MQITKALALEEEKARLLQHSMDSIKNLEKIGYQVYREIRSQYPFVKSAIIQPAHLIGDSAGTKSAYVVNLNVANGLSWIERLKLENWLKVRLNEKNIYLIVQQ